MINFISNIIIGNGGLGFVYKVVRNDVGKVVIKQFDQASKRGDKFFMWRFVYFLRPDKPLKFPTCRWYIVYLYTMVIVNAF